MRKLLSLFALWTMLLSQSPAQVQMDRINTAGVNAVYNPLRAAGGDLGAQIKNLITTYGQNISIAIPPSSTNYVVTTAVTNAGIGTRIYCSGAATLDISALSTVAAIQWTNAAWTNIGDQFVHPATGVWDCKFVGLASSNTGYVGLVSRISQFRAENVTIRYAGAFVLEGESITGNYSNVRVYNPYNAATWVTQMPAVLLPSEGGGVGFGPNGTIVDHPYCEEAQISSISCFLLQAGGIEIRSPYLEAISTAIRLNGTGATGASLVLDGGGSINFRKFPMVGLQIDGVQSGSHTKVSGITFSLGDTATNNATVFANTAASSILDVTGNTFLGAAANTSTCEVVQTTALAILNFTGNTVHAFNGKCPMNVLDPSGASGQFDQSTIAANQILGDAGSTFNFVTPSAAGTITNTVIAGPTFSRITNFTNLGTKTKLLGSNFIGSCPTVTFTAAGSLIGNDFPGSCSLTLAGSRNLGNTGLTNTENFLQTVTATNITGTGTDTFPTQALTANIGWTSGSGVPSAGTCTAANGGSLFSRTDGTTTTTLYVCDNSTHVWTAK